MGLGLPRCTRTTSLRATAFAACWIISIASLDRARADSSAAEAAPEGRSDALAEIIVTAQRREESVDKVPISVTALSQRTMDDLHIQNVNDLATVVPGLALTPPVGNGQDGGDIAIRGIYSSANGGANGNAPTTQLYIDETPIAIRQLGGSFSRSPLPDIFDLDRVEVLRGPQGTLFGASAMGGAIRFITPQPNLNDSSGFVKTDIGYTEGGQPNYEVGAAYGAPVVAGTAGFRVSAWYQALGGFIDQENPFSGQIVEKNANTSNAYVIRPAFTWAPSEALSITAALFAQHKYDQNPNSYWVYDLPNNEGDNHVWGGIDQPMTDDLRVSSLSVKYSFAGLSFVSDTSYLDRTSVAYDDVTHAFEYIFGGAAFIPGLQNFTSYDHDNTYTHAWQQEFRLSSQDTSSPVNWVAGAFYRNAVQGEQQIEPPDLSPITEAVFGKTSLQFFGVPDFIYDGQVLNSYDFYHTTDISEALFGDVTWTVLQGLTLDIGARYEHAVVEHQEQNTAGPIDDVTYTVNPDAVANPVTPRASLTYQLTDTDMVYVSAAKGYRPGGGNATGELNLNPVCATSLHALGLTSAPAIFDADSLWSYELGTKDLIFDRHLSIAGSVYYVKWSNLQTSVGLPSCGNSFTANEGTAVSQGFDLQLAAAITQGLTARAAVGYTDAYFTQAAHGAPVDGIPTLLNGAGDKLPNVVPWTAAASLEYSRDIGSIWSNAQSYLRLDYRWLGGVVALDPRVANYDPATGPYQNPAYGLLNIRLGVKRGGLDLSAYVNNATNSDPRLGYSHDAPGSPLFFGNAIRPLTTGVTAWYRF